MAFHTRKGRRVAYHCLRCEHHWAPRLLEWPNLCPRCKSRLWNTARTNRQGLRATPPLRATAPPPPVKPVKQLRMVMLKVQGVECRQCGHQWVPRRPAIRTCPKCRSAAFDEPKKTA